MNYLFEQYGWSPGIGDPTFIGWLTVMAYLACSYHSLKVYKSSETIFKVSPLRQKWLWFGIFCLLLALGINKQLDIQTLLTRVAGSILYHNGLHEHKRVIQQGFIAGVTIFGIATLVALFIYFKQVAKQHRYAIIGICGLALFVVIRAASFNNVQLFFGSEYLSEHFNWVFELGGIALIWLNARYLLKLRQWRLLEKSQASP